MFSMIQSYSRARGAARIRERETWETWSSDGQAPSTNTHTYTTAGRRAKPTRHRGLYLRYGEVTGYVNIATALYSTARHGTARHGTARHGTARHNTAQRSAAQLSTAQYSTAQHNSAQRSTIQCSTAQLSSTIQGTWHSTAQYRTI